MSDIVEVKALALETKVLYVEDDEMLRQTFSLFLGKLFAVVDVAVDGKEGLEKYASSNYDIVITDILMPRINGIEMSEKIYQMNSDQDIIIVSAHSEGEYLSQAIRLGVSGYILKPVQNEQMLEVLYKVLLKQKVFKDNENYRINLEEIVDKKIEEQHKLELTMIENYEKTLISLVDLIEERDSYTAGHSLRVAQYSRAIAKEMAYSEEDCELIYRAGILHDIGKMTTPDAILLKPGKLNSIEYSLIQEHVSVGSKMLHKIPMYLQLSEIISGHHERFDGSGYPLGLKGDEILPLSRIMLIADSFDAMTSSRIYKLSKTKEVAIEEIRCLSGSLYHAEVVPFAIKVFEDLELEETSQLPATAMEEERFAYFYKDSVTNNYNNEYLDYILTVKSDVYPCLNLVFLGNFTQYNERLGWQEGDLLLRDFSAKIVEQIGDAMLFRIHGDDFAVLSKKHLEIDKNSLLEFLKEKESNITLSTKHLHTQNSNIHSMAELEKYFTEGKTKE